MTAKHVNETVRLLRSRAQVPPTWRHVPAGHYVRPSGSVLQEGTQVDHQPEASAEADAKP